MDCITHTQEFEKAISVRPSSSHTYYACLSSDWSIGDAPHGGYLAALLMRASFTHFRNTHASRHGGNAQPINVNIAFLSRCLVGPAYIEISDLKLGQSTSTIRLTLRQSGSDKLVAHVIMRNMGAEKGLTIDIGAKSEGLGKELSDSHTWNRVNIPHPHFRRAPAHVEVYQPRQKEPRVTEKGLQWDQLALLRWEQGPRIISGSWSNEAAGFLLDVFPAPLAELEKQVNAMTGENCPVWFPTLSLNVDFKGDIGEARLEKLYSRITILSIRNGRMDIRVELSDEKGQIFAIGNHCTLINSLKQSRGKL